MTVVQSARRIVEIPEWKTTELEDVQLTASDERVARGLTEDGAKLRLDWLHGDRLRVTTTSWVGVVCLDSIEIRIIPRFVGGDAGLLQMLSYAAGIQSLKHLNPPGLLGIQGPHLLDLAGQLLVLEAKYLMESGPVHDYVTREETLPILRGRLRPLDQVRTEFARVDRLACRFDEYESDVPENRIVAAGLGAGRRICREESIRRRLGSLASQFGEICDPRGHDAIDELRGLTYHRRNAHYRAAHVWARLLIEAAAIQDLYQREHSTRFAFLLDMNLLFEQFVSQLLEDGLVGLGYAVHRQRRDASILFNELSGRPHASVIPDVVIEKPVVGGGRRMLPVDVKYKPYDLRRVAPGDIYQTFLYAFAYRGQSTPYPVAIVYPQTESGEGFRLVIRDTGKVAGARLFGFALDVPAALDAVAHGDAATQIAPEILQILDEDYAGSVRS